MRFQSRSVYINKTHVSKVFRLWRQENDHYIQPFPVDPLLQYQQHGNGIHMVT